MSVYVTELRLTRAAGRLVGDVQAMHRTLAHAAGESGRLLWALPRRNVLVVQADHPVRPIDIPGVVMEAYSTVKPLGLTGRVSVTLIGHPTGADGKHGTRRVLPMDGWEPWFRRKLADAVELDAVQVQDLGPRSGDRHGHRVTHRWVGFAGTGTVTDSAALDSLLIGGVGRGKAYGCGLLLAVPA